MKMFEVTYKRRLNDNMVWLKVYAPLVAKHAKPGQFIILRTDEYGERIPLTMAGHDEKDSTSSGQTLESWEELVSGGMEGMKIGVPEEYFAEGTDEEVKKALTDAMELMRQHGAQVEYFSLGMVDYVIPSYYIIACAEASSNLERFDGVKYGYRSPEATELHEMYKKSRAEGFGEEVKRRILLGSFPWGRCVYHTGK